MVERWNYRLIFSAPAPLRLLWGSLLLPEGSFNLRKNRSGSAPLPWKKCAPCAPRSGSHSALETLLGGGIRPRRIQRRRQFRPKRPPFEDMAGFSRAVFRLIFKIRNFRIFRLIRSRWSRIRWPFWAPSVRFRVMAKIGSKNGHISKGEARRRKRTPDSWSATSN